MVQTTIETGVEQSVKMKACIIWTLTSVMKDFSNRSGDDLHKVFRAMFTDSTIASNFQLGKDKLKYLTNWGLAPYFKELLGRVGHTEG